jgi:hypothetical protein
MTYHVAWRRAGALALALVLTVLLPVITRAAPFSSQVHPAALLNSTVRGVALPHLLIGRTFRPLARGLAPTQAVSDPTKLAFTVPSNAIKPDVGKVDATFADDSTQNVFTALNSTKYADSGMQSGYAEIFSLPIGSGSDTVDVEYLAGIYTSANQAGARVTSTQKYLAGKGITGQSCGTSCYVFGIQFPDSSGRTIVLSYSIWSSDNVVVELGFFLYQDVLTANNDAFLTLFKNVVGLATGVVPIQQAQTALTIVGFALAHTVNKTAKLTKKLKSGEKGIFVADIQYPNAGDTVQAQVTFTMGKKSVGPLLLGSPQALSSTEEVVGATHKFKVSKTTKVVAHLQVQDGSAQATQDLTFKVMK